MDAGSVGKKETVGETVGKKETVSQKGPTGGVSGAMRGAGSSSIPRPPPPASPILLVCLSACAKMRFASCCRTGARMAGVCLRERSGRADRVAAELADGGRTRSAAA